MSEQIQLGDVVTLASGSFPMTVQRIDGPDTDEDRPNETADLTWWDADEKRFHVETEIPTCALRKTTGV